MSLQPKIISLSIKLFLLIVICTTNLVSQSVIDLKNGCAFASPQESGQIFTNYYSTKIIDILQEISEAISLPPDAFDIKSSSVQSAVATTIDGRRMILYNEDFIRRAKTSPESKREIYSIIAHEIGHHILGHNFDEIDPTKRRTMELAADEFSGRVLRALCFKQEEALSALQNLPTLNHPNYPPKSARIAFVADGWTKKDEAIKREGRDPCGTIINLEFGEQYGKLNRASEVKAQVKEEEMIITYDAIDNGGNVFGETYMVTDPFSGITPNSFEWINERDKFGKNKQLIWHFGQDGYTREQVLKGGQLGLTVFPLGRKPEQVKLSGYVPGALAVLIGSGGIWYGFDLKKDALADYDSYSLNRQPNANFYKNLGISREALFANTDKKYVNSQSIRNASYFLITGGVFWLTERYLWNKKSKIGIIHVGENYIGMGKKFYF